MIDSWAWIEYCKATEMCEKVKKYFADEEVILTSIMNIAEVYKFLLMTRPEKANSFIQNIMKIALIIPLDTDLALNAAKIKHEKKMGMADAIVAATAEKEHARIITGDPDFKDFPNVIFLS